MARQPKTNTNVNGYNYYRTILTIGKNADGKPKKKQFYGSTKSEADNKKKQYIKDLEAGLNPDLSNQSLSQAMYIWLWNIERNCGNKSSSFERYEGIFRNYIQDSSLGTCIVSSVKKLAIQNYYNNLKAEGKSFSQIKNLHKLLNKFFGYAEAEGYIVKNPCRGFKISKDDEEEIIDNAENSIETFTREEVKEIVKNLEINKVRFIIMFALFTGAREGEILALEKPDIREDIVRINKSVRTIKVFDDIDHNKSHYEVKVTRPKTKTSNREVPLPDILKPELKKLELLVAQEKLSLGSDYSENNLLFPSKTGTYIDAQNLMKSWKRLLKDAGVPYKKFHALRNTYATRLFENGASILTVSRLLGHSSTRTTEIYTHVLENIKKEEVQCLNKMLI